VSAEDVRLRGGGPEDVPPMTAASALLRDGDRLLVPPLLLLALYLLMAGHNRPGGGFVAGLVVASALVLRSQARSVDDAMRLLPGAPTQLLAGGLALAALTALAPLAFGGGVLDQPFDEVALPLFGTVKLTAAFAFDIGVAVLVVGVVAAVLDAFGDLPSAPPGRRSADVDEEGDPVAEEVAGTTEVEDQLSEDRR
jgi:multisubunit Na+/H+ antiporter MnhB subunit